MKHLFTKRIITGLVVLSLMMGNLYFSGTEVKAAGHTQSEAVNWAVAQIGKGLDYDNYAGNQCVDLIKYYYDYFGVAGYAMGNANAYITNNLPSGWIRVYGDFQPGDIAVWKVNHSCSTCSTGSYGHVGIITSADSVGFNAVNQNFNNQAYCTQNWFYCSALACAIRPSYSSVVTPPPAPSISFADFNQNGVWDNNAEMYIKVMNPSKATVSKVGCYLYDAAGNLEKTYSEDCNLQTSYVNYNCNINNDMQYTLKPGTTYQFVLYAIVNGTEYKDVMRSFVTTGVSVPEPPVVTPAPAPTEPPVATEQPSVTEQPVTTTEPPENKPGNPGLTPTIQPTSKPTSIPKNTPAPAATKQPSDSQINPTVTPTPTVDTPAKVYLGGVRALGKRKIKVSWNWLSGQDGYQLQYAMNRSFTKKRKTQNKGYWTSTATIKKLKSGKCYYFRIRAYKRTAYGGKKYGRWSNVRKVKVR